MKMNESEVPFLNDPNLVSKKLLYDGAIIQLYRNQVQLEDGQIVYRELVHHDSAVAILPILDDDTVILVKQYRHAVSDYFIEIPAGLRDHVEGKLEEALGAAKRELSEETGYEARDWVSIGSYFVSPGFVNEEITLYLAINLRLSEQPLAKDEDEFIELLHVSRSQAQDMLSNGDIKDMKTALALNYWLNQKEVN